MRYPSDDVTFIRRCVDNISMVSSELGVNDINVLFTIINRKEEHNIKREEIDKLLNNGYLCVIAVENDDGDYVTEVAVTTKGLMAIEIQDVINRYN